jgi:competence protein ComEC
LRKWNKKIAALLIIILAAVSFLSACGQLNSNDPNSNIITNKETELTVYFLDVGQADSALVTCGGASMLIDGGNADDSNYIYSFLKSHNINHLDYVVATHIHTDHIGGLAGALNYAQTGTAFSPVTEFDSKPFANFVKYLDKQGAAITVPKPGYTFGLGGAAVKIIGPIKPSDEPNNTSIVLKITFGATSFLFTGDAEREEEADILAAGYDLKSTVLKVGHHGSETSTTYPFLREIMPEYAVISCGRDNPYGHPHEATLSKLRDADAAVYRTDLQGLITAVSDGKTVRFTTEKNLTNPAVNKPPSAIEAYYIGNINSYKFHRPDCSGLPAEKNRLIFNTREAALSEGYDPCGICKP